MILVKTQIEYRGGHAQCVPSKPNAPEVRPVSRVVAAALSVVLAACGAAPVGSVAEPESTESSLRSATTTPGTGLQGRGAWSGDQRGPTCIPPTRLLARRVVPRRVRRGLDRAVHRARASGGARREPASGCGRRTARPRVVAAVLRRRGARGRGAPRGGRCELSAFGASDRSHGAGWLRRPAEGGHLVLEGQRWRKGQRRGARRPAAGSRGSSCRGAASFHRSVEYSGSSGRAPDAIPGGSETSRAPQGLGRGGVAAAERLGSSAPESMRGWWGAAGR